MKPTDARLRDNASPDEKNRLSDAQRSDRLDDDVTEPFDHMVRSARRRLEVDLAMVSLVDDHQELLKGRDGLRAALAAWASSSVSHSHGEFPAASRERVVVPDARDATLLSERPVMADHDGVAYLGVPLQLSDGVVLGTLCVFHATPRSWSSQDVAALEELAALALSEIEFRVRRHDIEQLGALASRLEDPVAKLGDVTRTLTHLIEQPVADPRLPRLGDLARSRMSTVEALTQDLVNAARPVMTSAGPGAVDLREVLRKAADLVRTTSHAGDLTVDLPADPVLVQFPSVPTSRALNLLVTTALHYVRHGDRVSVRLVVVDDVAQVMVSAPGAEVPTGELLRIAGHFRGLHGEELPVSVSARAGGSRVSNAVLTATTNVEGASFHVCLQRTGGARQPTIPLPRAQK